MTSTASAIAGPLERGHDHVERFGQPDSTEKSSELGEVGLAFSHYRLGDGGALFTECRLVVDDTVRGRTLHAGWDVERAARRPFPMHGASCLSEYSMLFHDSLLQLVPRRITLRGLILLNDS